MRPKLTFLQGLGLTAAGLVPGLWLLMGLILWLPGSAVLTLPYALTYLLLPAVCLLLLWRTIRSHWRPLTKWLLSLLILGLSVFLTLQLMMWGHFSLYDHTTGQEGLDLYEKDIGLRNDLMPDSADLGTPDQIEYHYFYNQIATFFDSDCYTLICTYSPADYAALTAELDTRYTFHTAPLDAGDTDLPPLYELDGCEFRFLEMDTDTYHLSYPKYMILVGTNDETHEIVWSYYEDDDLDYIPDPERFLLEDCGWKYIR